MDREERDRGERVGDPGQTGPFREGRGGVHEFAGDEQIGAGRDRREVGIHIDDGGKHQVAHQKDGAIVAGHDTADEYVIDDCQPGAKRMKGQAEGGDRFAVILGGRDLRAVPAVPQLQGECEHGVQIAQRSERGEDDAGHMGDTRTARIWGPRRAGALQDARGRRGRPR